MHQRDKKRGLRDKTHQSKRRQERMVVLVSDPIGTRGLSLFVGRLFSAHTWGPQIGRRRALRLSIAAPMESQPPCHFAHPFFKHSHVWGARARRHSCRERNLLVKVWSHVALVQKKERARHARRHGDATNKKLSMISSQYFHKLCVIPHKFFRGNYKKREPCQRRRGRTAPNAAEASRACVL
jgi:hypothetical protein